MMQKPGTIEGIFIAPAATVPMQRVGEVRAIPGVGLVAIAMRRNKVRSSSLSRISS